ncbi:hypothetical protein FOA52_011910 [Chlamydomonas sp. UWO 241]|nr:hypothetical protein FOA52_011910 [Chlamydomonas sp. UWO 241]
MMQMSMRSVLLLGLVALAACSVGGVVAEQQAGGSLSAAAHGGAMRSLLQRDPDADPGDTDQKPVAAPVAAASPKKEEPAAAAPKKEEPAAAAPKKEEPAAKKDRKRPKVEPKKVKIVDFAPDADVTNDDDIDEEGKCAKEVKTYCDDVDEGEGKLADCISDAIAEGETGGDSTPTISDPCREEVFQYKIARSTNINKNVPLAKACKADAIKFCNVTWFFGYKAGQVVSCLRDVKAQLTKKCQAEVFKTQLEAANDFRADPMLYEACKDDAATQCKDVKNGGGRTQACLRDKRMSLSWACEEQLFRQEMENADDIRLSVRLFNKCLPDKKQFCKDIEPGSARVKECLEDNREKLSEGCKGEIDGMVERRVHDFRLDSKLRKSCENEIFNMCAYFGDLDDIDTYDSSIINCLQDYAPEIANAECKEQVNKYVALAASDIRFDVPLAEACFEDRQKFCGKVPPGSARVIRCLTRKRGALSPVCRATLFDEEVRFSENIDFQAPMKAACVTEIDTYCKDVPHGAGRVIRCLQDAKGEKDFGKACKAEVEEYEAEISKDYRLNYRLRTACEKDVAALCPTTCTSTDGQNVCGGKVLRCLTDKIDEIKEEACTKEVTYFEKMEVSNFRNDVILAEACRDDVDKLCATVEPGEGRVHKCLRDNRKKLSETCRKEELRLEEIEANNVELSVGVLKSCKSERRMYCKAVSTGSARVFRCLAENINDADFGGVCRAQILSKLQRRQANWKLDPPLRKACRIDVQQSCATADAKDSEDGSVYACMIKGYDGLSSGCQKELGRAVHMAFFAWAPGATLTAPCDADIDRLCLTGRANIAKRPGAIGSCLATVLERQDRGALSSMLRRVLQQGPAKGKGGRQLSDECFVLADIAEPPNMKAAFDSSLSFASLASQLDTIGSATGISFTTKGPRGNVRGISLTGWVAMLGMAALVVLCMFGLFVLVKKLRGGPETSGYTLVVKNPHK